MGYYDCILGDCPCEQFDCGLIKYNKTLLVVYTGQFGVYSLTVSMSENGKLFRSYLQTQILSPFSVLGVENRELVSQMKRNNKIQKKI